MAEEKTPKEVGHAVSGSWYGDVGNQIEETYELQYPQSNRIYQKMVREDGQVKAVVKALTLPIMRTTWQITPNGADEEVVRRVSEDLRLRVLGDDQNQPISRRRGHVSWNVFLQRALQSLIFGHAFFEQVYKTDENGEEHLHKLAYRPPTSITRIETADDGGLVGIHQVGLHGNQEVFIPVDRLVAFVYDPMDSTWIGTSSLRAAYKHWVLKDYFLRLEYNAIERQSMGIPIYTGTVHASDTNKDLSFGAQIAQEVRAGAYAGAAIPAGASLDLKGPSGQIQSPRHAIEYHDSSIGKSVLAHFLNLSDGGGSYALASTQADLFIQSLQSVAQWIAETVNQYVIEDLVEVAFPDYKGNIPLVTFDPIASTTEITPTELATLKNAGLVIGDRGLEEDVRRRYTLSPKPSKKEIEAAQKLVPESLGQRQAKVDYALSLVKLGYSQEQAVEMAGLPAYEGAPNPPNLSDAEIDASSSSQNEQQGGADDN